MYFCHNKINSKEERVHIERLLVFGWAYLCSVLSQFVFIVISCLACSTSRVYLLPHSHAAVLHWIDNVGEYERDECEWARDCHGVWARVKSISNAVNQNQASKHNENAYYSKTCSSVSHFAIVRYKLPGWSGVEVAVICFTVDNHKNLWILLSWQNATNNYKNPLLSHSVTVRFIACLLKAKYLQYDMESSGK